MSEGAPRPIRSPSYPIMPLRDAVEAVKKIENQYRASPVDRAVAAKLIGYSSLSGPANAALAALASYGFLERAGKGETRVTSRARAILHAENERERVDNLLAAASEPDLYRELQERFNGIPVPPEDGVVTYLNRQGFNPTAVKPAARAFLQTMAFIEELRASESHSSKSPKGAESGQSQLGGDPAAKPRGGAQIGDLIQWESQGVLQFAQPQRVRFVSDDGQWLAVDGSETGIAMNEVTVEQKLSAPPVATPHFPFAEKKRPEDSGFEEWFRAKVGAGKQIQILYRGDDDLGAAEIQKLIDILTAQKTALE